MITVKDLREKEFTIENQGYSDAEVDAFLDELAEQTEALIRENRALSEQLKEAKEKSAENSAADSAYFQELEATLRETLLTAQRNADETVSEARKKAEGIVADAEAQADAMLTSAKAQSDAANEEFTKVRAAIDEYRGRFLKLIEEQTDLLKNESTLFN